MSGITARTESTGSRGPSRGRPLFSAARSGERARSTPARSRDVCITLENVAADTPLGKSAIVQNQFDQVWPERRVVPQAYYSYADRGLTLPPPPSPLSPAQENYVQTVAAAQSATQLVAGVAARVTMTAQRRALTTDGRVLPEPPPALCDQNWGKRSTMSFDVNSDRSSECGGLPLMARVQMMEASLAQLLFAVKHLESQIELCLKKSNVIERDTAFAKISRELEQSKAASHENHQRTSAEITELQKQMLELRKVLDASRPSVSQKPRVPPEYVVAEAERSWTELQTQIMVLQKEVLAFRNFCDTSRISISPEQKYGPEPVGAQHGLDITRSSVSPKPKVPPLRLDNAQSCSSHTVLSPLKLRY